MLSQRTARLMLGCAGVFLLSIISSTTVFADGIIFVGPDPCFPAGVGRGCGPERAPHILSLQNHGGEAGGVRFSSGGDVRFGDWTRGSNTQTVTFAEAGIAGDTNLRLYFNINEPNGQNRQPVILNSLILTAYNSSGAAVFSASLLGGPLNMTMLGNGQGHSDFAFMLDGEAAARLQAVFGSDLRVGVEANISNTEGGPESFFIGGVNGVTNIPEPSTIVLLGTALLGLATRVLTKHRKT
jgi:hypothetical protein